jgi:hypothetical protein
MKNKHNTNEHLLLDLRHTIISSRGKSVRDSTKIRTELSKQTKCEINVVEHKTWEIDKPSFQTFACDTNAASWLQVNDG